MRCAASCSDPASQFLSQRLGLRLPERPGDADDVEPLVHGRARQRHACCCSRRCSRPPWTGTTRRCIRGCARARCCRPVRLGERQFEALQAQTRRTRRRWRSGRPAADADSRRYEVEIDGVRLHGRLDDVHPQGIARLRPGPLNGRAAIRHGLDWLLANAAGDALPLVQFHDDGEDGLGPHVLPPLPREQAAAGAAAAAALRREGLRAPLPYRAVHRRGRCTPPPTAKREPRAAARWYGSDRSWARIQRRRLPARPARPRSLRQRQTATGNCCTTASWCFTAVREGRVFAGFDDQDADGMSAPRPARRSLPDLPLDGVHLIEASAGTGKTFTLATLFTRLVVEKGWRIGQILAVTFTDAATQELRKRIRERLALAAELVERAPSEDDSPEVRLTRRILQRHLARGRGNAGALRAPAADRRR